ncbi:MAG: hypothetical protein QM308_00275 [Bacillota bacterium]|nr:hypothetical protein [Bacillota bacterium]
MKKVLLIAVLVLTVLFVSGCGQKENAAPEEQPQTAQLQESPLSLPTEAPVIEGLPEGYDPSSEEDAFVPITDMIASEDGTALHAGSTPIPLDPVDMPPPTKRPDLTFTFSTYTATNLGITFESVAGYLVDDSKPEVYILTEPPELKKDNYSVVFTFTKSAVTNNYNMNNLKTDIRNFAADLGKINYQEWRVSDVAERTLLGKPGYYITYRGVLFDGTIVRGRVHMALLDNNRVLSIHYTGPGEYNTDYSNNVFTRIRSTLKAL